MNQLLERLRESFQDEEARYAYAESYLNASIAAQIKELRGEMSQQDLADRIGTKQSGVSRIENANYSSWSIETLRKLARAFHLRLRISFEEFGTLIPEIENFKDDILKRKRFEDDPVFAKQESKEPDKDAAAEERPEAVEPVGPMALTDLGVEPWTTYSFTKAVEQYEDHNQMLREAAGHWFPMASEITFVSHEEGADSPLLTPTFNYFIVPAQKPTEVIDVNAGRQIPRKQGIRTNYSGVYSSHKLA